MLTTMANTILMSAIFATLIAIFQEGGKYWSRFMENKMAVSHFTDNKFGISRFTRKKKVFIRSVFLFLVKNYSQRTALFDDFTILPLLVLGAVKRKRILRPPDLVSVMLAVPDMFPIGRLSRPRVEGLDREWRFSNTMCTRRFNRTVEVIISLEKLKIT